MNISLLIIATNKYTKFLQPLIKSADTYFLRDHSVTYSIFTDQTDANLSSVKNTIKYYHVDHKPWPWMTLGRYDIFSQNENELSNFDYLYYCDADMLFVDNVGDEILGDRVATRHPAFFNRRGTPETNPLSLAYIGDNEEFTYFAGGFNGGSAKEYLHMSNILSARINTDFRNNIIAIWHDESHMNRYFLDNKPTVVLTPSYCYPENYSIPFTKKLLALDKNHQEMRA